MKRELPFVLVFIAGMFMIFQYFVPHWRSEFVYEFALDWIMIIGIFALALGIWSLYRVSFDKISTHKPNWGYSYVTLAGLFVMVAFGFTQRTGEEWGLYFLWLVLCMAGLFALIQIGVEKAAGRRRLVAGVAGALLIGAVLVAVFDDAWRFYFYTQEGLQNSMFRAFFDYVMMPILATMFSLLAFFIASAAYRAFRARNVLASLLLLAALIVMLRFNPWLPYAEYFARTSNWLMNVPNLAAQRAIVVGVGLGMVATALKVILGIERGYMGKG
ncbi:MAG: hypothetical protein ABIE70_01115 [bacterium]